uniref:Telomeric repeat-binding factor 2-interacting protein 1 n=1 Tax=Callorhinchus milii TaxID=7868 RepID=A0A4W3GGR5_CALMI
PNPPQLGVKPPNGVAIGTLFLDDSGAPLRFYMRPSSTKAVLLPLVTHGGGVMCGLQAPGALLLAELGPGPPLKGHVRPLLNVGECVWGEQDPPAPSPPGLPEQVSAEPNLSSSGTWKKTTVRMPKKDQKTGFAHPPLLPLSLFIFFRTKIKTGSMANNLPKKTGTLAEFIINNAQSESESQTQVDANSFSPTPSQNEVDSAVKAIETLRQEYHLDLCGATQVLLKNNGDLVATMHFMATGHRPDGHPIWTHQDDLDLESEEQNVKERLVKMFGADHLAKRRAFKNS